MPDPMDSLRKLYQATFPDARLRRLCLRAVPLLALLLPRPALAAQAPPPAQPRISAVRTEGEITIDGRLDEADWQRAAMIAPLIQQNPHPGEPTPYRTEVRILVDRENLYFGVTCADPEPRKIAMHTMQRDTTEPYGDDFLDLIFDTFGDRHTGYLFEIYPTGAQTDGLIGGPGNLSTDWDGIWESRTQITGNGWTAEIKIPSRTVHFRIGLDAWGFNVSRFVARDRTLLTWCCASLDNDLLDLTRAGRLEGVGDLSQGLGLSVSPYGLGRVDRPITDPGQTTTGNAGLDLAYSLTPGLPAVLTLNTDFAETEVDTRQVNLTRFSLFFPEKRSFFLEGSNQFEFASGLGTDFIPFYSRRVGLVTTGTGETSDSEPVPIDWGAKIIGHAGRFGIAALDIETGTSNLAPRTNLFAGRLTYDASQHLRLGTIVTSGGPNGISDNTLGGLDAVWHTSRLFGGKNLTLTGWGARTSGDVLPCTTCPTIEGKRDAWGAGVNYPNDHWNATASFSEYGDAFDPGLGFLPRPGTRQYQAGQAWQPRPSPDGPLKSVRQLFFETFYTQVDDLAGVTESRRLFAAPFNIETSSGEHFEANWIPQYELLSAPFEVVTGVVVPPGRYHFTRYRTEALSSESRPWRIGATVWFGGFYDGRLTQIENFVNWSGWNGHLQAKIDLQNDFGTMPEGNFIQRLWQLQGILAGSPRLILSSLFQYDTDSSSLGMNTRLRWTFRPGNDLFVVWNRAWNHPLDGPSFSIEPQRDEFSLKVRFVWRG